MISLPDTFESNPKGRLVFTASRPGGHNGDTTFNIHEHGRATAQYTSIAFWADQQIGRIESRGDASSLYSRPMIEYGWFQDIGIFTTICLSEPYQAQQDLWVAAVLSTIRINHRNLWVENDGNTI
jgi:hypothetical protein